MAREERAIFTNLCMVTDGNGNVLVQDRKDPDWGGITFPGGHVEKGESFVESAIREVYEETGLTIEDPRLCGTKQFQTKDGARYVVFFFKATRFTGELKSSDEGEVFWIPREKLLGVGVCMPGMVDGGADKVYDTFQAGWTEHNLSAELGNRLGRASALGFRTAKFLVRGPQ